MNMDHPTNATTHSPTSRQEETENNKGWKLLSLPSKDYQVQSWKVTFGSVVQKGETVALASRVGTTTTANVSKPTASAHKRPKKRARLVNATATATAAAATTPAVLVPKTALSVPPMTATVPAVGDSTTATTSTSQSPSVIPLLAPGPGILQKPHTTSHSSSLVIAHVVPCEHPTIVQNMCAVCGVGIAPRQKDADQQQPDNSSLPSHRLTVSGGLTLDVSAGESQRLAIEDRQRLHKLRKLSLVLDLDHTLVHATNDARAQHYLATNNHHTDENDETDELPHVRSLRLPLVYNKATDRPVEDGTVANHANNNHNLVTYHMTHYIKLRPHLREFLERAREGYELSVYSAGTRQYAHEIILILARHFVGARHDAADFPQLQRDLQQLQTRIQQWNQKAAEEEKASNNSTTVENGNASSTDPKRDEASESTTTKTATKPKPKKVSFGSTHEKTDNFAEMAADAERKFQQLQTTYQQALQQEQEAVQMAQRLFGGRIVSRTDTVGDLSSNVKSLKRMFPCGGTMAVVVDDREDVWTNVQNETSRSDTTTQSRPGEPPPNLLLCQPYHWGPFSGYADVNNAAGEDLSQITKDSKQEERQDGPETDEQLLWTADALKRIHAAYYESIDKDTTTEDLSKLRTVPELISQLRHNVLKGSHLLLSGVVPLHRQQSNGQQQRPRPPFVRYAETLGAVLHSSVQGPTTLTHVVAAKDGTEKVVQARRQFPSCAVVKPSWLMECVWSLTKRSVSPHVLAAGPAPFGSRSVEARKMPSRDLDLSAVPRTDKARDPETTQKEDDALLQSFTSPPITMTLTEAAHVGDSNQDPDPDGKDEQGEEDDMDEAFDLELEDDDEEDGE